MSKYAVFLIRHGEDQQITEPLELKEATDQALFEQANSYILDPESCGEIEGNYVVMPVSEDCQ